MIVTDDGMELLDREDIGALVRGAAISLLFIGDNVDLANRAFEEHLPLLRPVLHGIEALEQALGLAEEHESSTESTN